MIMVTDILKLLSNSLVSSMATVDTNVPQYNQEYFNVISRRYIHHVCAHMAVSTRPITDVTSL